jgi:hypothetical protein
MAALNSKNLTTFFTGSSRLGRRHCSVAQEVTHLLSDALETAKGGPVGVDTANSSLRTMVTMC